MNVCSLGDVSVVFDANQYYMFKRSLILPEGMDRWSVHFKWLQRLVLRFRHLPGVCIHQTYLIAEHFCNSVGRFCQHVSPQCILDRLQRIFLT